jgi:hypothetical protein
MDDRGCDLQGCNDTEESKSQDSDEDRPNISLSLMTRGAFSKFEEDKHYQGKRYWDIRGLEWIFLTIQAHDRSEEEDAKSSGDVSPIGMEMGSRSQ